MTTADDADALDAASLRTILPASTDARIASLEIVDTIDSTNSALLRRRTPVNGIVALFAERQTGGRGRHGRVWSSPPGGNLYLSLARCFEGSSVARLAGLSLAIGVAVAEALHALGADAVRVKWPNDLVAGEHDHLAKLGGVLTEGGLQDGLPRAVVGLGLNLRMPEDIAVAIDQPWTDLRALLGASLPPRRVVASEVLMSLIEALDRFDAEGLAAFLPRFAALDALRDAPLTATIDGVAHAGIAAGIAADGALRLRTEAGELLLRAGEVGLRPRSPLRI
jgi:BirA family transcriptional regulator, biotin operon repressor / biotin---[acetyl-CoA-carboxylase] ligase